MFKTKLEENVFEIRPIFFPIIILTLVVHVCMCTSGSSPEGNRPWRLVIIVNVVSVIEQELGLT